MAHFDDQHIWGGSPSKSNYGWKVGADGISLKANQEGLKTPPWNIPAQRTILWESNGGMEAGRITGYFEDSTPTPEDCRIALSAGDGEGLIYFYSNTFSSQLNLQDSETLAISGGGEKPLIVNAGVMGISTSSSPRIARIDLGLTVANPLGASFTVTIINTGNSEFFFRDKSSASLSGANIRTSGAADREIRRGSTLPVTYLDGTFYLGQDRN